MNTPNTNELADPVSITTIDFNAQDNMVIRWFLPGERYRYDSRLLAQGWKQWDTRQDAPYFGVWVHPTKHQVVTYAEGDVSHTFCKDAEAFRNELRAMEDFYGPAPHCAVSIDHEGAVTHYYDHRLSADDIKEPA